MSQVARRYDINANLVSKWLRDPRYAGACHDDADTRFLPVELVGEASLAPAPVEPATRMEIDLAGGVRLRLVGGYDPDALVRKIRGLSV